MRFYENMLIAEDHNSSAELMNDALCCCISKIAYDFKTHRAEIYFPSRNICDFTGCINFFKSIDPKVKLIKTFSGSKLDSCYFINKDNKWKSDRQYFSKGINELDEKIKENFI